MKVILTNKTNVVLPTTKTLESVGNFILHEQKQPKNGIAVGVFYVNKEEIQSINKEYRGKDKPTDVISFRLIENPNKLKLKKKNFKLDYDKGSHFIYLGEIFICEEVAKEQAKDWSNTLDREVIELFCHGMLHILGYDHEKDEDMLIMREHEQIICENLDRLLSKLYKIN